MTPDISLVIPTYQRCTSVLRLLNALSRQTLPMDKYEVIVVIDGSEDGTRQLLESSSWPFQLSPVMQSNQGRATACNTGILKASGELVVLLDDDMEPSPGFLEAHWKAHHSQGTTQDTRLGVLGAVPFPADKASSSITKYEGLKFNQHLQRLSQPGFTFKVRDFYSGNFSIRRDVLFEVGLFDQAFKIYGNEDLDLFVRMVNAKVRLVYSPEALAYQHYEKDFAAVARDEVAKGKTASIFLKKHPEALAESKISTYGQESFQWRAARSILLGASRVFPGMPGQVLRWVQRLEKARPDSINFVYRFALDYFFWLGVKHSQENIVLH